MRDNGHITRFTHGVICPVCGGCEEDDRGTGKRCYGFIAGEWIHCTRIDFANGCEYHEKSETFSHRLRGKCKCGATHNEGDSRRQEKVLEKIYTYRDSISKVVHETIRYRLPNGDKTFMQRRPDGMGGFVWSLKGITPVLYNLPALIEAKPDEIVWIVEGEKDADNLISRNRLATCNPMGALKWRDSYSEILRGRHCRIIPDNDDKGRQHARQVAQSLQGKVASVRMVELPHLPPKGDVSDWLANGGTIKQLDELATKKGVEDQDDEPLLNKDGKWTACLKNSEIWLGRKSWGEGIRYDRFLQTILVGNDFLSDELVISLTARIETETRVAWRQEHVRSAIIDIANQHQFSSLIEWLDSLEWDGEARIKTFFSDAYGCRATPYVSECARVLFLSAVARAYQPGCQADVMVVLIGPQGLGKSMGVAALCPFPGWYADDLGCDLFEGRAGEGLQGKWIFEFSEFARVNRATLDAVKSFVSRRVDHYRPPYGRIAKDFPRSCIFVGTTNDPHPLRDSENRRFMPLTCSDGNLTWIKASRDQLWAEAVERVKKGEPWWVSDGELTSECEKVQEEARMDDAWEMILAEKLDLRQKTTIQEASAMLEIKTDRLDKATQMRISASLKAIGFSRKREPSGQRAWYYWREALSQPQTVAPRSGQGETDALFTGSSQPSQPLIPKEPRERESHRATEDIQRPGDFIEDRSGQVGRQDGETAKDNGHDYSHELVSAIRWLSGILCADPAPRSQVLDLGNKLFLDPPLLDRAAGILKVQRTIEGETEMWSLA
jgi:predicted P-loop ATPase